MNQESSPDQHRKLLEHRFLTGIEQCQPDIVLPPLLPATAAVGRNLVLAAGKAATARVAHAHLTD